MKVLAKLDAPYIIQRFRDLSEQLVCDGGCAWINANDNSCKVSALKPDLKNRCSFHRTTDLPFWNQLDVNKK